MPIERQSSCSDVLALLNPGYRQAIEERLPEHPRILDIMACGHVDDVSYRNPRSITVRQDMWVENSWGTTTVKKPERPDEFGIWMQSGSDIPEGVFPGDYAVLVKFTCRYGDRQLVKWVFLPFDGAYPLNV